MQTALRWILNGIYLGLILLVLPVLLYRRTTQGKYRGGWDEKLWGHVPVRSGQEDCLWLHAVSVGEVLQLQPIIASWRNSNPDWTIVISTTTRTGREVAEKHYPHCSICYCPLDFTWAVRKAFQRIRPTCLALIELELWPNLILEARQQGVKTVLLNGRLSEKSFRGYRKAGPLISRLLRCFDLIAVQNDDYRQRFLQLGVDPEQLLTAGSIKFDRLLTDRRSEKITELRNALQISSHNPVLMGGSTHAPEEEILLDLWRTLWQKQPQLQFILAPRHAERFEEVAQLATEKGYMVIRRSQPPETRPPHTAENTPHLFLLDTLGELSYCWGLADLAYVGGSLNQRGGQNMMEPAAFGATVLFGPNTWNFAEVVSELKLRNACYEVADPQELAIRFEELLDSPAQAQEMGQRAQQYVLTQQGGTAKTLTALSNVLGIHSRKNLARAA